MGELLLFFSNFPPIIFYIWRQSYVFLVWVFLWLKKQEIKSLFSPVSVEHFSMLSNSADAQYVSCLGLCGRDICPKNYAIYELGFFVLENKWKTNYPIHDKREDATVNMLKNLRKINSGINRNGLTHVERVWLQKQYFYLMYLFCTMKYVDSCKAITTIKWSYSNDLSFQ